MRLTIVRAKEKPNLTLTSVVFEYLKMITNGIAMLDLTLTSVVFE